MLIDPTAVQVKALAVDPTQRDEKGALVNGVPVKCYMDPRIAPPQELLASQLTLAIMWLQMLALQMIQRVGQLELVIAERDRIDDDRSEAEREESRMRHDAGLAGVREAAKMHVISRGPSPDETADPGGGSALDNVRVD